MTKEQAKALWVEKIWQPAVDAKAETKDEGSVWDEDDFASIAVGFFIALGFTHGDAVNIYWKELIPEGHF